MNVVLMLTYDRSATVTLPISGSPKVRKYLGQDAVFLEWEQRHRLRLLGQTVEILDEVHHYHDELQVLLVIGVSLPGEGISVLWEDFQFLNGLAKEPDKTDLLIWADWLEEVQDKPQIADLVRKACHRCKPRSPFDWQVTYEQRSWK